MNAKQHHTLPLIIALTLGLASNPAWTAPPPNPTRSDGRGNTAGGTGVLVNLVVDPNISGGESNTGFGFNALLSNTTGRENTATGYFALLSNTTGIENTASGTYALSNNSTGIGNTASGFMALQSNTTGSINTATGLNALSANSTGSRNVATGFDALFNNHTGNDNTATGAEALIFNDTGNNNTANGADALAQNTTGNNNTAYGNWALSSNVSGLNNTAVGYQALMNKNAGNSNIAIGMNAGLNLIGGSGNVYIAHPGRPAESNTIRIGTAGNTRTFIGGIRGKTTALGGVPVLIDANGQLGTVNSSERFKKDIQNMDDASRKLLQLRPVTFRYKQADDSGNNALEYGLIAEEVANVYPDLVAYGTDGKIETVQYQKLTPMLLNEVQRLQRELKAQTELLQTEHIKNQQVNNELTALKQQVAVLKTESKTVQALTARLSRIEAQQLLGANNY